MSRRFITPQEKKRLSLVRDRRNNYGESDKGVRKTIPRKKRLANKRVRRSDQLLPVMLHAGGERSETLEDRVEVKTALRLKRRWRKFPDEALGVYVRERLERRCRRHGARMRRNHKEAGKTLELPDSPR